MFYPEAPQSTAAKVVGFPKPALRFLQNGLTDTSSVSTTKKRHLRGCQKSETESWKLWVEFSRLGLSWVFWIDLCRERRRPTFLLTTLCPTHLSPQQEEKLNHPGISCFSPTPRTPLSCLLLLLLPLKVCDEKAWHNRFTHACMHACMHEGRSQEARRASGYMSGSRRSLDYYFSIFDNKKLTLISKILSFKFQKLKQS